MNLTTHHHGPHHPDPSFSGSKSKAAPGSFFRSTLLRSLVLFGALTLAALPVSTNAGCPPHVPVIPPHAQIQGRTYGEWGSAWWQWALSIPKAQNPITDTTGEFAHVGQHGKVFFLAGTFGGSAERTIVVPKGKFLFFPMINTAWAPPEDIPYCQSIATHLGLDPNTLTTEQLMTITATWSREHTTELFCEVDGRAVNNPFRYQGADSGFSIELSDIFSDFGYTPGLKTHCASDGHWIMLPPLSKGKHTVRFGGRVTYSVADGDPFDGDFNVDVLYHITVK